MKIELHYLQNFAPSNLNRDDTGAPKDCEFGGVRRARISSQCLKRAMRQAFAEHRLFGDDTDDKLATRTKRLVDETARVLASRGKDHEEATRRIAFALGSVKLKVVEDRKTQYLLFVPKRVVGALADVITEHWDALGGSVPKAEATVIEDEAESSPETPKKKAKKTKGAEKAAAKDAVPKEVCKAVEHVLEDASRTPDLALFGRMIADNPDWNTDAACQVAHALSTNRVSMEFDFYTAVDDLRSKDSTGSDMMGTIAFQSACFYRYTCLDVDALRRNLGGTNAAEADRLALETIEAFARASALAIPSGKQNSMAAQNLPSYLLAVVRNGSAPQSFANAFEKPVRPEARASLVEASAARLETYLDKVLAMWGSAGVELFACSDLDAEATPSRRPKRHEGFQSWVEAVRETSRKHLEARS